MPARSRSARRFDLLVAALAGAMCRLGRGRIGDPYAAEVREAFVLRLADFRGLPPLQRWRRVGRELIALFRLATLSPAGSRPPRPHGRARLFDRLGSLWFDLRVAMRQLLRAPAFSLLTLVILALGIGANSAVFSVVNAVLVRPLPYPQPQQLLRVSLENPQNRFNLSVADFQALRESRGSFARIAAYTSRGSSFYRQTFTLTLSGDEQPTIVEGTWVTADYFEVLGIPPRLGRTLVAGEDAQDAEPVVVISHAFWRDRYASSDSALGSLLEINGIDHTVVGVMPAQFRPLGNDRAQLWPAFRMLDPGRRGPFFLTVVARLADGVTAEQADQSIVAVQELTAERWGDTFHGTDTRYVLADMRGEVLGSIGETVWVLFGAVALVLLIALANVAGLMLTRSARREREFAVRAALGAGRSRLLTQLLLEGTCLAAAGAMGGVVVGNAFLRLLLAMSPTQLPRQAEITLDATVVLFASGLALASALVLALVPLGRAAAGPALALRGGGRAATGSRAVVRTRAVLVFSEVALAVPLLVGALLMVATLQSLQRADLGFEPARLLTMRVALPVETYEGFDDAVGDLVELLAETGRLAGARSVALGSSLPPDRLTVRNNFRVKGMEDDPESSLRVAHYASITADYFAALGIPQRQGRVFDSTDRDGNEMVAIVDQAFVDRYLEGRQPLGVQMQFGGCDECPWARVVGVVGNVSYRGVGGEPEPTIYVPLLQEFQPQIYVVLRSRGESSAAQLRGAVSRAIPGLAGTELRATEGLLADSVATPQYRTVLLSTFAFLAAILATVGIYGVLAQYVSLSTREFGVRKAIGARRADICGLVVRRAALPLGAGLSVGVGLSLLTGRLLAGLVHGVEPDNVAIIAAGCLLLGLAAMGGTLVPARRAMRIDPAQALRSE